jgi:hypothetical protein
LGIVAMTAARQKTSFFSARYKRVRARRGHRRALVALAPTILELCWHLLTTDQPYHDHYDKRRPGTAIKPRCNDSATPAATSPPTTKRPETPTTNGSMVETGQA